VVFDNSAAKGVGWVLLGLGGMFHTTGFIHPWVSSTVCMNTGWL
jgi:hypothetical protein